MSYRIDKDGYVLLRVNSISNYGASEGGTPENNFTYIQSAINAGHRQVTIGRIGETYEISQPLYLVDSITYVFDATLKIKDGLTAVVTSNVLQGASGFDVDHPEYFNVGEWVAITDDAQLAIYETLRGTSGQITDITENTITFDSVCSYAYAVAENARVSHCQSTVISSENSNITIIGYGGINGNKDNQDQIHPVRNVSVIEDQRAACGLVIWKGTNITVKNITVYDSLMHNVSITGHDGTSDYYNSNIIFDGVTANRGHDKNFLIRDIDGGTFSNLVADEAIWEDGVIFYIRCKNITLTGVTATNNNRAGVLWNSALLLTSYSEGLNASNIITSGNGSGIGCATKYAAFSNITMSDYLRITNQYSCNNVKFNNIDISNVEDTQIVYLSGGITDIVITNLTINGCSGIGIKSVQSEGEDPVVVFSGGGIYNHTGTKFDISEGSEITFNNFINYP